MRNVPSVVVAIVLGVSLPSVMAQPRSASCSVKNQERAVRIRDKELLRSCKTLYVLAPNDAAQEEIWQKLLSWGRLSLAGKPEEADLILEMKRIDAFRTYHEFGEDNGLGQRFDASLRHRVSGVEFWSTTKSSIMPRFDYEGTWAARAIADALIKSFAKLVK